MTLRRGFKTEANWYARQFRLELGLALHGPLCPWRLAEHLCVPVYKLSEFAERNPQAAYFLNPEGLWEFSGATFISGRRRLIVINDGHSPKRQASDLSHELSHCILAHAPSLQSSITGPRQYDRTQEEEANYLGPALLISEEAALAIARRAITKTEASAEYSVTEEVIQMRLNLTGAFKRVAPRARYLRNTQTRKAG
jgi:Zn-dependent peptidase ImmA (M78 family)